MSEKKSRRHRVHVVPSISIVFEEMVTCDLYFPLVRRKEITQRAFDVVVEYEDVDLDSQKKVRTTRILCLESSPTAGLRAGGELNTEY